MKKIYNHKAAILLFSFLSLNNLHSQTVLPFDSTITYQLLLLDAKLYGSNNKEIALCKALMEKACQRIVKHHTQAAISKAGLKEASDILAQIDSTFTEFNFLFNTDPKDIHYNILTLALREEFSPIFYKTPYQKEYWRYKTVDKCKLIDCDQYSRIYLGIAQMIHLPVSAVHIPRHYYLRWYFPDDSYFSWNPNDASVHLKETTMECYDGVAGYNEKHKNNCFPQQMTINEVKGNYYTLLADNIWDKSPAIKPLQARETYVEALKTGYISPSLFNNYVWLQIMNPELDQFLNITELHGYIDQAILLEKDVNHYDAKACLYALQKNFIKAVSTSKQGLLNILDENNKRLKAETHLECFLKQEACRTLR